MYFKEVSINEIIFLLEQDVFNRKFQSKFNFLPSEFCEWAYLANFEVKIELIEEWEKFEESVILFDEHDFKRVMFRNAKHLENSSIVFLSDECLKLKIGYQFSLDHYDTFVGYYENRFDTSFFQPLDYIIIFIDHKEVRIIFHEGKLITISPPF